MSVLGYHRDRGGLSGIRRWIRLGLMTTTLAILVLWLLSYCVYVHGSIDVHILAKRFAWQQTHGIVFLEWMEIHRSSTGVWQPTIQVELDSIFGGFGSCVAPGRWTKAGEIAVPYWAFASLFVLLLALSFYRDLYNGWSQPN
jgi:hypothetical protein